MSERQTLVAFAVLVAAICYLATIAAVLAFYGKYAEALGFGGLTTGLVGVLGTFKPRTTQPDQPQPVKVANGPQDPVPVEAA
ncbi:hypothetical protein C8J42_102514 [Sphingomonas sp. PP-CE-1A-559]|uniref:hypothetical protein n=1 Tax=Sphingomonas sp. PP-CE-1A-559 TaxID=2135657 RepID=UPI0010DA3369|nr:hypothetical protein [Sphingomonas sp. PP-CE-1A-559]TCP92738.1 hypothetical protein C8J42_102514 [Sphingomonas sp. PP-CE-1A-559]